MNASVAVYNQGILLHTDAFSTLASAKHYAQLICAVKGFHALLIY